MIARGEVLERMTLVRSGEILLEALTQSGVRSVAPAEPVVLAGPHPRLGGNMDAPVMGELVWALARAGHPTLRFNWRGIGASQGRSRLPALPTTQPLDLDDELADLGAAIDLQREQHGVRTVAVVGYSVGAIVAARLALTHDAIERVVLVSPVVRALPSDPIDLAGRGVVTSVFTGACDDFAPAEHVAAWVGVAARVVASADHSFQRGLSQLGASVVDALGGPAE